MKTLIIVVVVLLVLAAAAAWFMAGFTCMGQRQTLDGAFQWQTERYDTTFYTQAEKTDYLVAGANGYVLHVQELENPVPTDKWVIISHGYTDNRMGALKYAGMYLDLGFNCVIYDLRGHGENERTATTYGILESQDLAALIDEVRARHPEMTQLGLHGESLGAATTLTALGLGVPVDFAVSDCAFSDIENVLRGTYKTVHAPQFLFDLANIGTRVRFGYALTNARPIDALANNQVPILFMHGADDWFITPQNSQDLYDATQGPRDICLIEGAEHAEAILVDPVAYQEHVSAFLDTLQ